MTISELVAQIHIDNVERGWWDGFDDLPLHHGDRAHVSCVIEKLALVHSELSEGLEAIREGAPFDHVYFDGGKPCGFPTEVADAVIRLFDLSAACGFNLDAVIATKLAYNRTRGPRHGGKVL